MKPVLRHIFARKREYAKLPFFDFLRDESLSPQQRLSFFPCMAPFIMSFGDLNRFVLREEPTEDPYLRMINAHTYEDDHHWPWYLEDWRKLGYDDMPKPAGDTIRFMFSDATIENRLLSHRLAHLVWGAEPVVRLAIIEAIEETGNVLFELTTKAAVQFQNETGLELRYCGEFHFALESGHAMNNDHAELALVELTPAQREDAMKRVDLVYAWFTGWVHELHRYAMQNTPVPEMATS